MHDNREHPPAERFNAGQKIVFWGVVLGAVALLASGLTLMFPFYWLGMDGMQDAAHPRRGRSGHDRAHHRPHLHWHDRHEGAFSAMWTGEVDRTWAKEHHGLWYEELTGSRGR